ncbi:MAG TPA: glycosyltransferase [Anaerolineales bacterium]|nr:glycosyltransferase [Anaerolineales bacterium]
MRIAYVTIHIAPEIMRGGVGKKIRTHIKLWREYGHAVTLFSLTPAEIPFPEERQFLFDAKTNLLKRESNRASGMKRMLKAVREYQPDIIYLRFGLYSYPLHEIHKIAPVVVDTNSNDVDEYRKKSVFFYWLNRLTRNLTFGPAAGVVSPSYELVDILVPRHDKPVCVVANGVDLTDVEILPAPKNTYPVLTLVGTPGMSWHGVDKLIEFAKRYPEITINIVGYGPGDVDGDVPANVKLHGFLNSQQVKDVLAGTDVACGTLAFHRNKMHEASALKVREALTFGIPVLIAFRDTDLHDVHVDTILQIPNTEDNLVTHAEQVHDFAYRMMGKRVDLSVVGPYLDQRKKEQKRLAFFEQVLVGKK